MHYDCSMSISIPTTAKEINKIKRQLRTAEVVMCLDAQSYVKVLLIAQQMVLAGKDIKAEIVKGFDQEAA